jgi:hypothetical protein
MSEMAMPGQVPPAYKCDSFKAGAPLLDLTAAMVTWEDF